MTPTETLQYYRERQSVIVDAIREIVDNESPSHDAVRSRAVVDWVERQALATGIDVAIERISVDDGDHIVIRAFPGGGKHTLLLGHTDTVHPVGTYLQNPTRIEGDKLYGCGIFDMKANIVLVFEALRFCAVNGTRPKSPVTILLSCDEEVGSHTGREFVEREAAGAARCLVVEPSAEGRIKSGRKGTGQYTLRARGIPAHAGLEPEKGANAVAELARHIDEIHAIQNADLGTTVNVCTIKGGTTSNVIPEHAECEIDVRFSKMSEGERVDAALRSIRPIDGRVSLEMLGGINRPPLERTAEVAALFENARSIGASFGYEVGETQVGGASDGNFVAALGVPVLDGLGIAGAGAHRLDEHILVSDIANRATLVTQLLIS
ncbi:MAG: M20 family metallopeptidase [Pyrinomonadaceae bacterium]|nr:M20 family metallopeptidase [Acidobacteriota bacterium]MBK7932698.1 M20 family metallopeptidase [Acidobacteriota bacterium]MBP7375096.1 M20 family metallopeptidase [Pyrinomonadaceae bacterium]